MLTPLILFFGLTVATAVIAHWSDNLGKKLGKKRVSLMGLRPRTTATILTIASSWGIMIFTLVALLGTVEPLRHALFFYDSERAKALSDRETAKNDIEAKRALLNTTRARFGAANQQLGAAEAQLVKARASVAKSRATATSADEAASNAKATAKRAEEVAQKQAEVAQKRVDEAQEKLLTAQKAESLAKIQAGKDQLLSGQATQSLNVARTKTNIAQSQLKDKQAQYKITQSQYKSAQVNLKNVQRQYENVGNQLFTKTGELIRTESQLKITQQQLAINSLYADAFAANDAPVKVNQVFAASRIVANQRPELIVTQLRDLLQQGQELFARTEDMAPTPNFPSDATLQLVPRDVQETNGKSVQLQGEPLLWFLARAVRNQTTANLISARLVAWRNHLAGEKIIGVKFEFVPIKPAFAAGDILASATIDGAQGDARIFSSLLDLTELGQLEAKKRGVNPSQSLNEPSFYAEGTNVKIFETLRLLANSKSRLSVNLVTDRALTTVEPLQVRFEIESQPIS